MRFGLARPILLALALGMMPVCAWAQSQFTGLVRDEQGGALPGVTVEAASPGLIEKVRTVVTDGAGRYAIIDLRPGVYKVTYTLAGFATTVRDAIELPSNFVATINVDLRVGSLEETITVSGQTPIVDVQQASRTVVLGRDLLDDLPTTRSIQSIGQLIPGIRLSVPDVGGERVLEAPANRAHGMGEDAQTLIVDGFNVAATAGGQMPYTNDQLDAEVSVRTSAIPASISSGGVNLNSIPKDGGNTFSGAAFLGGFTHAWQSDNITPELTNRGLNQTNAMAHIRILSASIGGPIKRNKVWFFFGARHADADELIANTPPEVTLTAAQLNRTFTDWCSKTCGPFGLRIGDVERTALSSYIRDVMVRFTVQATPRNKFAVFFDRGFKDKDNEYGFGTDPVFASNIRDDRRGLYPWGYFKWTSTLSSKLLIEAGEAYAMFAYTATQKPFNELPRFLPSGQVNPAWIANARRQDSALNINPYCTLPAGCLVWWTGGQNTHPINARYPVSASVSYVTGSHNIKTGFEWSFGQDRNDYDRQADLAQVYNNGVPQSVTVANTPLRVHDWVKYDAGIYLQDSWTFKRLTLNPGVRIEYYNAEMKAISVPAGRFVPARYFPAEKNLPNWTNDVAPRFSAAYDLFGDGKTAIKMSASKYYQTPGRSVFVQQYAAAALVTESRNWFDVDLTPGTSTRSGIARTTDNDGIAQDNEIGPSGTTTFGTRPARGYDPNIQRASNNEYTAGVNHQVFQRMAVGATYYHRSFQNLTTNDRVNIIDADYTAFQVRMPSFSNDPTLAGILDPNEMLTIYNLDPAKRTQFAYIVDRNGSNTSIYDGIETNFTTRLANGANVYGGWNIERTYVKYCDNNDDPNGATVTTEFGIVAANGGRFCDQSKFDIPFRSDFKLAGNMPLRFGFSFAAVFQNYPGTPRVITWSPAASVFPGGGRTNTETIIVSKPGSVFQPRYNQLDVNIKKSFRYGTKVFTGQFDLFNATNSASILTTTDAIGSSLGQINSILKGRMPRIAFQFKF
jgi:carboxypeptidase family protein